MTEPSPLAIDVDELTIHRLYRERVVQEDAVINHRMTWFFASQSFLVLSWAALYKTSGNISPASLIIDFIAIWFAYNSQISINAAHKEIEWLDQKYRSIYKNYHDGYEKIIENKNGILDVRNSYVPTLVGGGVRHRQGQVVTRRSSLVVYGIWILGVAAYIDQIFHFWQPISKFLHIS